MSLSIISLRAQKIAIGALAGPCGSTFMGNGYNNNDLKRAGAKRQIAWGAHTGFTAEFKIYKWFSIQPKLLYANTGFSFITTSGTTEYDFIGHNIQLPIAGKFNLSRGRMRGYINLGLYANYQFSNSIKYTDVPTGRSTKYRNDFNNFRHFDYGACAGLGGGYKIKTGELFIEGNYLQGLLNQNNDKLTNNILISKNRVFNLSIGYLYPLSKE